MVGADPRVRPLLSGQTHGSAPTDSKERFPAALALRNFLTAIWIRF